MVFSFTTMSKCRKRPWNLYKYKNSFLKTYFPWPWSTECITSSFFRNLAASVAVVQKKPSTLIRRQENKVEFLERQFPSEKLSFVLKKETGYSFELAPSICVFYRRIFNLEMQNFSLENHPMMNSRQPLFWWMITKVSNPLLSPPPIWLTT